VVAVMVAVGLYNPRKIIKKEHSLGSKFFTKLVPLK